MSIKGFSVGGNVERYDYNALDNIPSEITIDTALSDSSTNPVQNKVVTGAINATTDSVTALSGEVSDLKSAFNANVQAHSENAFKTGNYQILSRYINVSTSTLGADSKPTPAILIEPNSLYAVSCNVVSHKRLATSWGYATGIKLTAITDGGTDNKTMYIKTGNADKYLFIQLYTDADTIKDASQYYPSLSVVKIEEYTATNNTPPEGMLENAYIAENSGNFTTSDSSKSAVTLTTRYYINSKTRMISCDSPYKIIYYQYENDNNADFSFNATYIGSSDPSCVLIIPDNSYWYRISIVYANSSETAQMTEADVIEHVHFFTVNSFPTRYGKSAYFAPFVIATNYYPTYQTDFSDFNRNTTTAELYAKLDTLISQSNGYITKQNLGLSSDGVTQLIRLDCVENGVDAARTARYNLPKIVIVAGQHGGEKCSCYSLYYFLKDLLENWDKDTNLEWIRYHAHLVILPVANPYGFDRVVYENANGVNLNRNYVYNWDSYGSGSAPLSEPETQIIAALVKKERSAIYLADYHCQGDGTVLPADGRPNWHSQLQTYDSIHDSIGECSKTHIDNISRHWWKEYTFLDPITYGSCGQVDTGFWATGYPTLQGYASRNGIIANTFEALNGFTGREGFGAEGAKACTELIGNWIIAVFEHFAKFFDISQNN